MSLSPAERQRRHYARYPDRCRERWRAWSRTPEGTITVLLNYARDRARRGKLAFDLDRDWLRPKLEAGICELSGLALQRIPPDGCRTHPFAPSLDREKPELGYVKTNVRLVCFAVNFARSDWGDEVLLQIAAGLMNLRK